ncbi:MAG: GtrA family protein [Alistipes sp.]|nr:GtrA family protein [Alistipes sp.]
MSLSSLITKFIDLFYVKPLRQLLPQQVFRYLVCGAITVLLDTVWYYIIYHYIVCEKVVEFGAIAMSPHIASLVVVFPITFFTGFWLNRNVAFHAVQAKTLPQIVRYALTVVGSIALNYICMKLFVEYFDIWATPSKVMTTVVCALYSYLAGRYYTFATKRKSKN